MRYFFKFDAAGTVTNWQIAETDATAEKLIAAGYIEVTYARYRQLWQVRDQYAALPLNERTV